MSSTQGITSNMEAGPAVVSAGLGVILAGADEAFSLDGLTPTVPAVLTDSTGGTATTALAATVGVYTKSFPILLAGITDADVVTSWVPGHKFKILALSFVNMVAVTTGSKATTLNLEIGTTDLTGGVLALTSANQTPKGVVVNATAITAANTGSASAAISIEATSTTAFAEGSGVIEIRIQDMDIADAFASIADRLNDKGFTQAA